MRRRARVVRWAAAVAAVSVAAACGTGDGSGAGTGAEDAAARTVTDQGATVEAQGHPATDAGDTAGSASGGAGLCEVYENMAPGAVPRYEGSEGFEADRELFLDALGTQLEALGPVEAPAGLEEDLDAIVRATQIMYDAYERAGSSEEFFEILPRMGREEFTSDSQLAAHSAEVASWIETNCAAPSQLVMPVVMVGG